mmetsp:Transcript_30389/g.69073  ORF Transcript_30389/g.69073 Transcript_30389/m.69073 type:complete len:426 (+) Transcript_30389:252-1529(+)
MLDELDNPELRLLGLHVQLGRDHADVDALVDAAVRLEDQLPRVLFEFRPVLREEVVALAHEGALLQLALGLIKVHVGVEGQEESGDRVAVAPGLVVHNPDGVLHDVLQPPVQDQACPDVAEEVGAGEGDDGQALLVEEEIQKLRLDLLVHLLHREDGEERPVKEPRALQEHLPLGQLAALELLVEREDDVCGLRKLKVQDEGAQGAPDAAEVLRIDCLLLNGDHTPVVLQELAAQRVDAAVELKLGVVLKAVDDIRLQVEGVAQLGNALEGRDPFHHVLILQDLEQLQHVLPRILELLDDLVTASHQRVWSLLTDHPVLLHCEVYHVGLRQERDLGPNDVCLLVHPDLLHKLQNREDQVPIKEARHFGSEVVLGHLRGLLRGHLLPLVRLRPGTLDSLLFGGHSESGGVLALALKSGLRVCVGRP